MAEIQVFKDIGWKIKHLGDFSIYPGINRREYELAQKYFQEWYKTGEVDFDGVMRGLRDALPNDHEAVQRAFGQLGIFANPSGSV